MGPVAIQVYEGYIASYYSLKPLRLAAKRSYRWKINDPRNGSFIRNGLLALFKGSNEDD